MKKKVAEIIYYFTIFLTLSVGACGTTKGTAEGLPGANATLDLRRLKEAKCDAAEGICRHDLVADLGESNAGKLSMLAVIQASITNPGMALAHLGFQTSSAKVTLRGCSAVVLTVAGAAVPLGPGQHHEALQKGRVVEALTIDLPPATLKKIAGTRRVKFGLCGRDRLLRPEEQALLRRLVQRWERGAQGRP